MDLTARRVRGFNCPSLTCVSLFSRAAFKCPGSVGRSAAGVNEGLVLKQTLRDPAGRPLPRKEHSLCVGSQLSTTIPIMPGLQSAGLQSAGLQADYWNLLVSVGIG